MSISGVSNLSNIGSLTQNSPSGKVNNNPHDIDVKQDFNDRIKDAVNKVAETQTNAADAAKAYELGQTDDLAGVMVEQQVASLSFQMTMQVRNKALTAYKDIMNMPV